VLKFGFFVTFVYSFLNSPLFNNTIIRLLALCVPSRRPRFSPLSFSHLPVFTSRMQKPSWFPQLASLSPESEYFPFCSSPPSSHLAVSNKLPASRGSSSPHLALDFLFLLVKLSLSKTWPGLRDSPLSADFFSFSFFYENFQSSYSFWPAIMVVIPATFGSCFSRLFLTSILRFPFLSAVPSFPE